MLRPCKYGTLLSELFGAACHVKEMIKIINWLNDRLSADSEADSVDLSDDTVVVQDVEMPDIYSEHDPTVPGPKIIDVSSPTTDESEGFNPYDTAVLRNK
jgi:hypothetical protein